MTQFNFLSASDSSFVDKLRQFEVTPALRTALVALAASLAVCASFAFIEGKRLETARKQQTEAVGRSLVFESRMARARAKVREIGRLRLLVEAVRAIQVSGANRASLLAEIGDRLPADVWIKQIARDGQGVVITGEAHDYRSISFALSSLARGRTITAPALRQAQRLPDAIGPASVAYELRVVERTR